MTSRSTGAEIALIQRGEVITADWLNHIATTAERNARRLNDDTPTEPVGEDGDSGPIITFDETARTTSTVRIEDDTDPSVYVEIDRIDTIEFAGDDGSVLRFIFTHPP